MPASMFTAWGMRTPMPPIKVLSIFGTRPEAVKMAPVVQALAAEPAIASRVCVTAQHREMLDQVLDLFGIRPDVDLDLMRPGQTLAGLTASILSSLDPVLEREAPDWILVQGDTTTVFGAALLAFYRQIRVGHVEAGLRTGDRWQPFPEEINRRITGILADLHFAPTELNRRTLLGEGVKDEAIAVTGNPVIDALQQIIARPEPEEAARSGRRVRPGPPPPHLYHRPPAREFRPAAGRCVHRPAHAGRTLRRPGRAGIPGASQSPMSPVRCTACWTASPTSTCCRRWITSRTST